MIRYITHFPYYLEYFAKRLSGRGNMNPNNNGEYKLLKNIFAGVENPIFIDVGANEGDHSIFFLKSIITKNYKLYLFEPNIKLFEKLKIKFKNKAVIINSAVGEKIQDIEFYTKSDLKDTGSSSIIPHYYLDKVEKVKMITLDFFVKKNNIEQIDFIKIDVEGYEEKILIGALNCLEKGIPNFIQIEYTP